KDLGITLELVSYNGANLALDAAAKGETTLAISHQSQARGSVEAGTLTPIAVFDDNSVNNEVYKNLKGVGEYGYTGFFRNRCFVLARKGTDPKVIETVRNAYLEILKKPDVVELFKTLMIEYDPLTRETIDAHIDAVTQIVKANS
ncbi:MAG: hypothetical protein EOM15_16890, partial [Spirochaetia bacterium]|nr:hypothetical protein [Spirochaetia bacterium]